MVLPWDCLIKVRRILQTNLDFDPYKLKMIAQKLYENDWEDHIFIIEHTARRTKKALKEIFEEIFQDVCFPYVVTFNGQHAGPISTL